MLLRHHNASLRDTYDSRNFRHAPVMRSGRSFHGPLSGGADPRREKNEYGVRASPFRTTLPCRYVVAWRCISQDSGKFCGPSRHWSRPNHYCSRLRRRPEETASPGWPAACAEARHASAETQLHSRTPLSLRLNPGTNRRIQICGTLFSSQQQLLSFLFPSRM